MMNEIDALCHKIMMAKEVEEEWKQTRVQAEIALANLIASKQEGTDKKETDKFRITVTSKLTRTLNYQDYQKIADTLPENLRCVVLKPEIDMKKMRALEMVDSGITAQFITTKQAKPSVKIEPLEGVCQ